MINAKAWHAQIMEILRGRHERGERLGVLLYRPHELHEIPSGAVCFVPSEWLTDDKDHNAYRWEWLEDVLSDDPVCIHVEGGDTFVAFDSDGAIDAWSLSDFMQNWVDPDEDPDDSCAHYILVIDGLNIPLQDALTVRQGNGPPPKPEPEVKKEEAPKERQILFL